MDYSLIVSIISFIVSTIISLILLRSTIKIHTTQLQQHKQSQLPNLLIKEVNFITSNTDDTYDTKKHIRYYFGRQQRSLKELSLTDDEDKSHVSLHELVDSNEIDYLKSHKGSVYFTQFNKEPCLFINLINNTNSFIVEHHNTEVVLYNTGFSIRSISINWAKIHYSIGGTTILPGVDSNSFSHIIGTNEAFSISFNEASNEFTGSVCNLNPNTYKNLPESVNLLEYRFDTYFLAYKKLEFYLTITDVLNNTSYCLISLEHKGDSLVSKTQISIKPLEKRISKFFLTKN